MYGSFVPASDANAKCKAIFDPEREGVHLFRGCPNKKVRKKSSYFFYVLDLLISR